MPDIYRDLDYTADQVDEAIQTIGIHVANNAIHVNQSEKDSWNAKADSSALSTETSAREAADTALQTAVNSKADASALTSEISARETADASINSRISAIETDQRRQDTEISTKITLADIFGVGTLIADNTDLDNLTAIGKYYGGNSAGNTVLHLPVENGSFTFSLEVRQATPSMTYQYLRICRLADDPYIYIRRKYTTWGTWYRFTGEAVAAVQSAPASLMQAGRLDSESDT